MNTAQRATPPAEDPATPPPAHQEGGRLARIEDAALAVVAGLGLGTYAALSYQIVIVAVLWFLAAVLVGVVWMRGLHTQVGGWVAVAALFSALCVWAMLWSSRPKVPWSGPDPAWDWAQSYGLVLMYWLLVPTGMKIGMKTRISTPARAARRACAAIALPGAIALVASTGGAVLYPSGQSYSMELPPGWTRFPSQPYWYQMWPYGRDLTAQYGSSVDPDRTQDAVYPTIAISVQGARHGSDAQGCYQTLRESAESWMYVPLDLDSDDSSVNPNPDAYYVSGRDDSGAEYHVFTLARTRLVGAMTENLCYLAVFTLPRGSPITEADVTAIFSTFRFR